MSVNKRIRHVAGRELGSKKSNRATKTLAGHVLSKCRRKRRK